LDSLPALSIAQDDGIAVAVAGRLPVGWKLGVDVSRVRPLTPGFEAEAFRVDEQRLLTPWSGSDREEWALRLFGARRAAARAMGLGPDSSEGMRTELVRVLDVDSRTGAVKVALDGMLAPPSPRPVGVDVLVNTFREGEYILALTACEASSS
jgi:hypothetical protein